MKANLACTKIIAITSVIMTRAPNRRETLQSKVYLDGWLWDQMKPNGWNESEKDSTLCKLTKRLLNLNPASLGSDSGLLAKNCWSDELDIQSIHRLLDWAESEIEKTQQKRLKSELKILVLKLGIELAGWTFSALPSLNLAPSFHDLQKQSSKLERRRKEVIYGDFYVRETKKIEGQEWKKFIKRHVSTGVLIGPIFR